MSIVLDNKSFFNLDFKSVFPLSGFLYLTDCSVDETKGSASQRFPQHIYLINNVKDIVNGSKNPLHSFKKMGFLKIVKENEIR